MWHIGIDLHRRMLVMAAVNDDGEVIDPQRIECQDTAAILEAVEQLKPFRTVIEATGTYRWLYDLLSPHGTILLAHPLRLRAMIQRRAKTDKLDAQLQAGCAVRKLLLCLTLLSVLNRPSPQGRA